MRNRILKKILLGTGITAGALSAVVVTVPFIMLFAVLITIPFSRVALEHDLKDITNESDVIPVYVTYWDLHIGDETVHVSQLHRNQNKSSSIQEIFCVSGGKAYYVYMSTTGAWTIASLDLETEKIQDHCAFSNTKSSYRSNHYGEYDERMGFYYDGKIILTDYHSVLEYDIAKGVTKQQAYDTYVFPTLPVYGECADDTLTLYFEDSTETFTLEDMASKSKGIAKIYELKDKKNWNGYSYLAGFLATNTTQVIDERIYFMDAVMNYHGEPVAIILEYDRTHNMWLYVSRCFVGSDVAGDCYIIPNE